MDPLGARCGARWTAEARSTRAEQWIRDPCSQGRTSWLRSPRPMTRSEGLGPSRMTRRRTRNHRGQHTKSGGAERHQESRSDYLGDVISSCEIRISRCRAVLEQRAVLQDDPTKEFFVTNVQARCERGPPQVYSRCAPSRPLASSPQRRRATICRIAVRKTTSGLSRTSPKTTSGRVPPRFPRRVQGSDWSAPARSGRRLEGYFNLVEDLAVGRRDRPALSKHLEDAHALFEPCLGGGQVSG